MIFIHILLVFKRASLNMGVEKKLGKKPKSVLEKAEEEEKEGENLK